MINIQFQKIVTTGLAPILPKLKPLIKHLSLLNGLLLLAFTLSLALQKNTPQTVVFSKGMAITSFAKELNDKGVSEVKQGLLVRRFVEVLPKALEHYATKHRVVVLSDKEVLAGAPNITQKVLATVAKEMLQQNKGAKAHG